MGRQMGAMGPDPDPVSHHQQVCGTPALEPSR